MVSSGLIQFDDRPENYWAWKTSFQSITHDLNLTHQEELDLLVKWHSPESSTQAKRIRSVQVTSPAKAVDIIREDCYSCPEVIEHALLKRLEDFPHVSNKDPHQLRVERSNTWTCIHTHRPGCKPHGENFFATAFKKNGLHNAPGTKNSTG